MFLPFSRISGVKALHFIRYANSILGVTNVAFATVVTPFLVLIYSQFVEQNAQLLFPLIVQVYKNEISLEKPL